jgi:hypothetical protein
MVARNACAFIAASLVVVLSALPYRANAAVEFYGDENVLNSGQSYPSDPTAGTTLQGLTPGTITKSTLTFYHVNFSLPDIGYPTSPYPGDFPGTDQIYVGSVETAEDDGYSEQARAIHGPDNFSLDYNSLVPSGQQIATFTLGISFDDFQDSLYKCPYTLTLNGTPNASLSAWANSFELDGPSVQFSTIGVDPSLLSPSGVLSLSIDEGGNGGDGYAVDFLTVGITTVPLPEPTVLGALAVGAIAAAVRWRKK